MASLQRRRSLSQIMVPKLLMMLVLKLLKKKRANLQRMRLLTLNLMTLDQMFLKSKKLNLTVGKSENLILVLKLLKKLISRQARRRGQSCWFSSS